MKKKSIYSTKNIVPLHPSEHIRKRTDMYIGGTDSHAMHRLIFEVLGEMLESVFINKCSQIKVRLQPNRWVTIENDDSAFPDAIFSSGMLNGISSLHEFYIGGPGSLVDSKFRITGGLNGVGSIIIFALSRQSLVTLKRNGFVQKQPYNTYHPATLQTYQLHNDTTSGVTYAFQPDFTIFDDNDFDFDLIAQRCQEIAYIVPDVTITLIDERTSSHRREIYHYPYGIRAMVRNLNVSKTPVHDIVYQREVVTYTDRNDGKPYDTIIEIAFQYTETDEAIVRGYANTVFSELDGTHIEGFRHALMDYVNATLLRYNNRLSFWEVSKGLRLTAVISIFHVDPEYESTTRIHLLNSEMFGMIATATLPLLKQVDLVSILNQRQFM